MEGMDGKTCNDNSRLSFMLAASGASRMNTLLLILFVLVSASPVQLLVKAEEKPPAVSVESFVSFLDRDGDGEIGTEEANKFLEKLETSTEELSYQTTRESPDSSSQAGQDISMAALMNNHKLDIKFNYGGNSISVSEMTDHLGHMLTGDRVVAWVIHGLRLPQYAEAFEKNSIDGLDFPTLISDNGAALRDDLGITSTLHRNKILAALVRQVFGIGQVPDSPQDLSCSGLQGGIMLHWTPPATPGIPPFHKFLIKRRRLCPLTGAKGSWKELGDTAEESWMDSAGLQEGQEYEYRVQSWSAHGPSDWVNITGCRSGTAAAARYVETAQDQADLDALPSRIPASKEAANNNLLFGQEIDMANPAAGSTDVDSHVQRAAATAAAAAAALGPAEKAQYGDGTVWGFVWSVNGGLLLLGLLSRSSFLFRAFSTTSACIWYLISLIIPTSNSSNPFVRRLALLFEHLTDALHALRLALLGDTSPHSAHEHLQQRQFSGRSWREHGNRSASALSSRSGSLSAHPDHGVATPEGGSSFPPSPSGLLLPSSTSEPSEIAGRSKASSAEGDSRDGSDRQPENLQVQKSRSSLLARLATQDKIGSSKNRCNAQDCSVQFNTLMGFVENLKKHYCRDCQSWYCARHTRIISHSTQHCRFDSQCRCFSCFSRLPAASQVYLESINRAQPQKQKKEVESSLQPGFNGVVAKSASEGGPQDPRNLAGTIQPLPSESKLPSPRTVRRSASEYALRNAAKPEQSMPTEYAMRENRDGHSRGMRKSSSSVETSPSLMQQQGVPWFLKSGVPELTLGGESRSGGGTACSAAGAVRADEQSSGSKNSTESGLHATLSDSARTQGSTTSRLKNQLSSSIERICELGDEASTSGQEQQQQTGHLTPTTSSNQTTPSRSGSTPLLSRSSSSGLKREPSFGRSRSLRAESTSQLRRDKELTPSPGDEVGLGSLRHRCNSMEHLPALDSIQQEVEEVTALEENADARSSRKQLSGVKGVFKRSLETFSSILPTGSPKNDDPSRLKRKEPAVKAPREKARSTLAKLKGGSSGRGGHE